MLFLFIFNWKELLKTIMHHILKHTLSLDLNFELLKTRPRLTFGVMNLFFWAQPLGYLEMVFRSPSALSLVSV
jgi:hypothetical protein